MYSLVEAWAERKRRREAFAKLTAVKELVDKDGKILVDKDHEKYPELVEAVDEIKGTKKLAELDEEAAELEKRLKEIEITKKQMKGKLVLLDRHWPSENNVKHITKFHIKYGAVRCHSLVNYDINNFCVISWNSCRSCSSTDSKKKNDGKTRPKTKRNIWGRFTSRMD